MRVDIKDIILDDRSTRIHLEYVILNVGPDNQAIIWYFHGRRKEVIMNLEKYLNSNDYTVLSDDRFDNWFSKMKVELLDDALTMLKLASQE